MLIGCVLVAIGYIGPTMAAARPELFIVGDVQGCHLELLDLLDAARFDPNRQQLAFVLER